MKRTIISLLLTIFLLCFCACDGSEGSQNPPGELLLTDSKKELVLGDEYEIRILSDEYRNTSIEWTTDNPNVISLANGKITANSTGTATVTAKAQNGKSADCLVSVTLGGMLPVLDFEFDYPEVITVNLQEQLNFEGFVIFNDTIFTDVQLSYTVFDKSIGIIDEEIGMFTPISVGQTTVSVKATWRGIESELLTKVFMVKVIN